MQEQARALISRKRSVHAPNGAAYLTQGSIKVIESSRCRREHVIDYYKRLIDALGSAATLINTDDSLEELMHDSISIINKHALVVIDDYNASKRYDWNAFINRVLTSAEKAERNCNIVIATRQHLTKSTLRSRFVKLIEI